jgi:hypothetical protein
MAFSEYHSSEMSIRLALLALAMSLPSAAQQSSPPPATNQVPLAESHPVQPQNSSVPIAPVVPTPDQEKIQAITHRVELLEIQAAQRAEKSKPDYSVAIIGALAVIGASIIGIVGQLLAAKHAERLAGDEASRRKELAKDEASYRARLARDEARYKQAEAAIEFRMKQVQEFYAPMSALLRQSKNLYDKMLDQLVADEPSRYRKVPKPEGNDFRWEVLDKNSAWQGFRLLDQFPAIKKNPRALALADKNLEIGNKICDVISHHAGYASESIADMLGQFTSHHVILTTIRDGPESEPFQPGWHSKLAYFPFGLDTKIRDEYHEISKSIDEFREQSTHTLEKLAKGVD